MQKGDRKIVKFEDMVGEANLLQCWEAFCSGKRARQDIQQFAINLSEKLEVLSSELLAGTYHHGPYTQFKVFEPKMRIISKATVRDRLVHHVLANALNTIFEPQFIHHSYASRVGKGTHQGVMDLQRILYRATKNNTLPCYFLKCDIKKFVDSTDQNILFRILSKNIHELRLLALLYGVISSYATVPSSLAPVGFPIGNVTSQVFSNIYMNELDQYVKHTVRALYYLRYTDDFLLLSNKQDFLVDALEKIQGFLEGSLHLGLHPHKITLAPHQGGIDWLGYHLFFDHRLLRTTTKRRMFQRLYARTCSYIHQAITFENIKQTAASYIGMLAHATQHRISIAITKMFMIRLPKLKRLKGLFFLKKENKLWKKRMQGFFGLWGGEWRLCALLTSLILNRITNRACQLG